MKVSRYINFLLLMCLLLFGCSQIKNDEADSVVLKWMGKKINLIDTLPVYDPISNSFTKYRKPAGPDKLIVYIDGTCFTCAEDFVMWGDMVRAFDKSNVDFLFYLNVVDLETMKPYFHKWRFTHPVVIDKTNSFYVGNKISPIKLYQAMVLDKENKVILFGNPVYSEKLKDLYISHLKKQP
jgi:hypothetical protein